MANKGIVAYLSKLDDKAMAELMAQVAVAKGNAPAKKAPAKPVSKKTPAASISPYAGSIGKIIVYCYSGRVVNHKFYEVIGVTQSRVKLQELGKKSLGGSMWDMKVVPDTSSKGEIITKAIREDGTISMGKYEGTTNINAIYDPEKSYSDNLMD